MKIALTAGVPPQVPLGAYSAPRPLAGFKRKGRGGEELGREKGRISEEKREWV